MYSRRYFKLLCVLVVMLVAMLLVIVHNQIISDTEIIPSRVSPTSNVIPKKAGFFSKFQFYNKEEEKEQVFPLSDFLIKKELYKKETLTVFQDSYRGDTSEFDADKMCPEIRIESDVHVSDVKLLEADFNVVQDQFEKMEEYSKLLKKAEEKFESKLPKEKQWFRFAGSSVWLDDLQVHYMVSRLIYSPSGIANKGFASFLYVQTFDRDWNEVANTMSVPYEQEIVKNVINLDGSVTEVVLDSTVAYRDVKFPSLLPIPFDYLMVTENGKYYFGPEDPRIIKRTHPKYGYEEPVIVFNMKSLNIVKRVMFSYTPFNSKLTMLKKRSEPFANIEKNWTPFISKFQKGNRLNFMYSVNPLEVVTCELDTGMCDFLQKIEKEDIDYIGAIRGGSQLESLPIEDLPQHVKDRLKLPENRNIYIGWARTHLTECGCGESMYRPNLVILVEDFDPESDKYRYKLSTVSDFFDFNSDIPKWSNPEYDDEGNLISEDKPQCDRNARNVLIPNSIAYWNIESVIANSIQYGKKYLEKIPSSTKLDIVFNDYMGITLSAADADVKVVHVRGMLNYISQIKLLFDPASVRIDELGSDLNQKCSEVYGKQYCVKYADMHGGIVSYD